MESLQLLSKNAVYQYTQKNFANFSMGAKPGLFTMKEVSKLHVFGNKSSGEYFDAIRLK
jgi:hypothetical protein